MDNTVAAQTGPVRIFCPIPEGVTPKECRVPFTLEALHTAFALAGEHGITLNPFPSSVELVDKDIDGDTMQGWEITYQVAA